MTFMFTLTQYFFLISLDQGLLYAYNIHHLLKTIMNLHVSLAKPMTKTSVLALCRLIELLKAIEHTFHRRSMLVTESINHIIQHLSFLALASIGAAKVSLVEEERKRCKAKPFWNLLIMIL